MTQRIWTAALLVVGDEILSGRTQDKNIAQVASWLQAQGIRLAEVRVVPDVIERIAEAVNALRVSHDYLFTTGGIGPTHDDITVDAVAHALGVPVVVHPRARAILEDYYATRGGLNEGRLRMARAPEGSVTADITPATTIATEWALQDRQGELGGYNQEAFGQIVEKSVYHAIGVPLPPDCFDGRPAALICSGPAGEPGQWRLAEQLLRETVPG